MKLSLSSRDTTSKLTRTTCCSCSKFTRSVMVSRPAVIYWVSSKSCLIITSNKMIKIWFSKSALSTKTSPLSILVWRETCGFKPWLSSEILILQKTANTWSRLWTRSDQTRIPKRREKMCLVQSRFSIFLSRSQNSSSVSCKITSSSLSRSRVIRFVRTTISLKRTWAKLRSLRSLLTS